MTDIHRPEGAPIILFVPGLLPKPAQSDHRDALWTCLLTGISRIDADLANTLRADGSSLDVVAWTYDFYGEHRDIALDAPSIAEMLAKKAADASDIAEASSWQRRLLRFVYRVADRLPFSMTAFAGKRLARHLRDLKRYELNVDGGADAARNKLKDALLLAAKRSQPVLLIGHSMGSIIAYDVLWQMSDPQKVNKRVDLFLTMGSPLGQRFLQHRLKAQHGPLYERYPNTIRHWKNLAAVGDLTALDRTLSDDFRDMVKLGLVDDIEDISVETYFRLNGELNVHTEYGYLVAEKTAHTIAKWWRRHDSRFL